MENYFYNLQGGLNTELTPVKMGANSQKLYWADGYNVEPYKNQGIIRQKGNQIVINPAETEVFNLSESPKDEGKEVLSPKTQIAAVFPYPQDTKNLLIALTDGRIFLFDAKTKAVKAIYEFKRQIRRFRFRYFLDGVVILPVSYTGSVIDGIYYNPGHAKVFDNLNLLNALKDDVSPVALCQYAGRLWVSAGNTLYYSALGTYNDWTTSHDAGYISNFHSDTAEITALEGYRDSLAIYKKNETYLLSGNDTETFNIVKFADKGTSGPGGVVSCNNKQYFFNAGGLFSLSYVGELNQIVMGSNCAKNVLKLLEKLDLSRLEDALLIAYEKKNQIWIFPPLLDEKGEKEIWIFNYELDSWFRRIIPYEITGAELVLGDIYTISSENPAQSADTAGSTVQGCIFVENKGNTFALKPIKFKFSTPFFYFSKPTVSKIIEDFEIICDGVCENNFYFSVSADYMTQNPSVPEIVSVNLPNVLVWSGFEDDKSATFWSDGVLGSIWNDTLQENLKLDIFEANKSVQLHFEGKDPGQDLAVIGFEFKNILYDLD